MITRLSIVTDSNMKSMQVKVNALLVQFDDTDVVINVMAQPNFIDDGCNKHCVMIEVSVDNGSEFSEIVKSFSIVEPSPI